MLELLILANTRKVSKLVANPSTDDNLCATFNITILNDVPTIRLNGDKSLVASSFEVELSWNEKCAYKLKVRPIKALRKHAKELIRVAAERTWGEHNSDLPFAQDAKLYANARKALITRLLKTVVSTHVSKLFEETRRGI